jgi:hypothetical protein
MRKSTTMPLNQPSISWRPVAPALCLALVLAGRDGHLTSAARVIGRNGYGAWRPR